MLNRQATTADDRFSTENIRIKSDPIKKIGRHETKFMGTCRLCQRAGQMSLPATFYPPPATSYCSSAAHLRASCAFSFLFFTALPASPPLLCIFAAIPPSLLHSLLPFTFLLATSYRGEAACPLLPVPCPSPTRKPSGLEGRRCQPLFTRHQRPVTAVPPHIFVPLAPFLFFFTALPAFAAPLVHLRGYSHPSFCILTPVPCILFAQGLSPASRPPVQV